MSEIILETSTLPEPLFSLIGSKKVKVNQTDGIISLIPIDARHADCPLLGLAADSSLTVERFLAMTHDITELG